MRAFRLQLAGQFREALPILRCEHLAERLRSIGVRLFANNKEGVILLIRLKSIKAGASNELKRRGLRIRPKLKVKTREEVTNLLPMSGIAMWLAAYFFGNCLDVRRCRSAASSDQGHPVLGGESIVVVC